MRREPRRLGALLVAVLALAAVAAWTIGFSPLLAVRSVRVDGLTDAERAAVVSAAAVPVGTPLARIDTVAIEQRVRRVPTVSTASVTRSWPATVVITVGGRTPVLAVRNSQGQLEVVDAEGVAYQSVPQVPAGVVLVNAGASPPAPEGLRTAVAVLALLPPEQRATVRDLSVSGANLVSFTMRGKTQVVWGGAGDAPRKLALLTILLATNPAVIDVSAPDTPVTR